MNNYNEYTYPQEHMMPNNGLFENGRSANSEYREAVYQQPMDPYRQQSQFNRPGNQINQQEAMNALYESSRDMRKKGLFGKKKKTSAPPYGAGGNMNAAGTPGNPNMNPNMMHQTQMNQMGQMNTRPMNNMRPQSMQNDGMHSNMGQMQRSQNLPRQPMPQRPMPTNQGMNNQNIPNQNLNTNWVPKPTRNQEMASQRPQQNMMPQQGQEPYPPNRNNQNIQYPNQPMEYPDETDSQSDIQGQPEPAPARPAKKRQNPQPSETSNKTKKEDLSKIKSASLNCSLETEAILVFELLKDMNRSGQGEANLRPLMARSQLIEMEKLGYSLDRLRASIRR